MLKKDSKPLSSLQQTNKPITNVKITKPLTTISQVSSKPKQIIKSEVTLKPTSVSSKTITTSTKTKEEVKINSDPQVENLKFTLKKKFEFAKFTKEIEKILTLKALKINLTLETKFDNDRDLLDLSQALIKVGNRIRNLVWKIQGGFTDDGLGRQIGETIGRFTQAYSIILDIRDCYFADRSACSLALGLKKLQNLKVLKINPKKITSDGNDKIVQAISTLKNLQYLDYNGLQWYYFLMPNTLRNYVYEVTDSCEYDGGSPISQIKEQFQTKMSLIGNHLVSLRLKNYETLFETAKKTCCCCQLEQLDQLVYEQFYKLALDYAFSLPYLTQFQNDISYYEEYDQEQEDQQIKMQGRILQNLILSRLITISQIYIFNQYMVESITINPTMIVTDLFID